MNDDTIPVNLTEREVLVIMLALKHWEGMHTMFEHFKHEQEAGQIADKLLEARESVLAGELDHAR